MKKITGLILPAISLKMQLINVKDLNIPVSIVVVDNGGHLMALARLDSKYGINDFAKKRQKLIRHVYL